MEHVLKAVAHERSAQHLKWGQQDHSDGDWCLILMEEVGEAAQDALKGHLQLLRQELIQVAAVAVAWIEALDRR